MRYLLLLLTLLAGAAQAQTGALPVITAQTPLRPLETASERMGWQAVGRLDTGVGFCTATLIGPETVLTAAHCLYHPETGARLDDRALRFLAGYTNGQVAATRRVSVGLADEGYTHGAAPSPQTVAADLALLRLDRPIPISLVRPLAVGDGARPGETVQLVSYGRERENAAALEDGCAVIDRSGPLVILSCQVDPGTSGAPVLARRGGAGQIVSIISASAIWQDRDVGVAVDLGDRLTGLSRQLSALAPGTGTPLPQVRRLVGPGAGRETVGARFVTP